MFPFRYAPRHSFIPPALSRQEMAVKLFNLIALSSLAIIACSFAPSHVVALSIDSSPNYARHLGHHHAIAHKKRADSKRCKPRPVSSSSPPVSKPTPPKQDQPAPKPATTKPASTPAPAAPPASAGKGKVGLAWANGDDGSLKNFVTSKVSTCDFFLLLLLSFVPTHLPPVSILGVRGNLRDLMPLVWTLRLCSGEPSKLPISSVS